MLVRPGGEQLEILLDARQQEDAAQEQNTAGERRGVEARQHIVAAEVGKVAARGDEGTLAVGMGESDRIGRRSRGDRPTRGDIAELLP